MPEHGDRHQEEPLASPPPRAEESTPEPKGSIVVRAFDATFRFLSSLKLAVICLATLAATLAYGTKFNSDYGLTAANEYIYLTKGFALLMAFLGHQYPLARR